MLERRLILIFIWVIAPLTGILGYYMMVKLKYSHRSVVIITFAILFIIASFMVLILQFSFKNSLKKACKSFGFKFKRAGIGEIAEGKFENFFVKISRATTYTHFARVFGLIPERIIINMKADPALEDKKFIVAPIFKNKKCILSFFRKRAFGKDFDKVFEIKKARKALPLDIKTQIMEYSIPQILEVNLRENNVYVILKGFPTKEREWEKVLKLASFLLEMRNRL